jgi:hypothetical protein
MNINGLSSGRWPLLITYSQDAYKMSKSDISTSPIEGNLLDAMSPRMIMRVAGKACQRFRQDCLFSDYESQSLMARFSSSLVRI